MTTEEVEARLREEAEHFARAAWDSASAGINSNLCEAAADTLADLRRQRDEARAELAEHKKWEAEAVEERIEELNAKGEAFNKECWNVLKLLMKEYEGFDWQDYPDGMTADAAFQFLHDNRVAADAVCVQERLTEAIGRAEKAEHWSQLRDEDIMKLGQELGKWQAAAEAERAIIANKAREYAGHYPPHSDGLNSFVALAEWIEALPSPPRGGTKP